jgi:hypothetical protein
VRDQDYEIDRPHNSLPRKLRRAMLRVISQVRNQKQNRHRERGDLAITMGDYVLAPDKKIARGKQDKT